MQDRPVILMIETTGPLASVALTGCGGAGDPAQNILQLVNETHYSHLEEIAPMVQDILAQAQKEPEDLDAIAVSRGPGSFTGIRIGMATAKAFAQVWQKPILCVPTLATFAYVDLADAQTLICPLFDARRSQVYAGVYAPGDRQPLLSDGAYDLPDYLEKLAPLLEGGKTALFFGDGSDVFREALEASGLSHAFAPQTAKYQLASCGAKLALQLFAEGQLTDVYSAEPEYLRQAEAERRLNAGLLGKKKAQL